MVILKNCEPELSYILAELFNMCLKDSCFPGCWKVSSVVPVFKNVWVVSDRTAWTFNRFEATRAIALDISKAFDRVWHVCVLHKLKSYGTSGQVFGLISSFLSNKRLRVVLDGNSSQEYPVNVEVPQGYTLGGKSSREYPVNVGVLQGPILGPTVFLLYINDLPDDVICGIAICADDTSLHSKCDQASDLWHELELTSELESDLRDFGLG